MEATLIIEERQNLMSRLYLHRLFLLSKYLKNYPLKNKV